MHLKCLLKSCTWWEDYLLVFYQQTIKSCSKLNGHTQWWPKCQKDCSVEKEVTLQYKISGSVVLYFVLVMMPSNMQHIICINSISTIIQTKYLTFQYLLFCFLISAALIFTCRMNKSLFIKHGKKTLVQSVLLSFLCINAMGNRIVFMVIN